jgi:hypothetical protein
MYAAVAVAVVPSVIATARLPFVRRDRLEIDRSLDALAIGSDVLRPLPSLDGVELQVAAKRVGRARVVLWFSDGQAVVAFTSLDSLAPYFTGSWSETWNSAVNDDGSKKSAWHTFDDEDYIEHPHLRQFAALAARIARYANVQTAPRRLIHDY